MSHFAFPNLFSKRRIFAILIAGIAVACVGFNRLPAGEEPAGVGIPEDWSHRHLIYSQPATFAQAIELKREPRYWYQSLRRNFHRTTRGAGDADSREEAFPELRRPFPVNPMSSLHADWSQSLGAGAATVGAGNYPAKFAFASQSAITSANCTTDFAAFNTGLAGAAGQAAMIAFNKLYANSCAGPAVYWAYNTGGTVVTSPVLSADGSQIAFVQSLGGKASLAILKWKAGEGTSATAPASPGNTYNCTVTTGACSTQAASYVTCRGGSTSCLLTLQFDGATTADDTDSSPFYDYAGDNLYVGDDSGVLHKFAFVFKGTPAEVISGWPVTLATGLKLTSPVFDGTQAYAGSANPGGNHPAGSILYSVPAAGSTHGASSSLGHGPGIIDAPIVDASAGKVYVFIGNDGTSSCPSSNACSAVYQFSTGTISGAGAKQTIGTAAGSTPGVPLYAGTFDNAYFTSTASSPTGRLYVCGNTTSTPILYSLLITNNVMAASVAGPTLTSAAAACSPVSEAFNGTNDWLFLSVTANGNKTGCTGACVYNFDVHSGPPLNATAGLASLGGASGIIIDNLFSGVPTGGTGSGIGAGGTSQMYFSPLITSHAAVQASQAALQ